MTKRAKPSRELELEEPESGLEDALRAMRVISPIQAGVDAEGKELRRA
jgi:hypothetical protein